jgi:hypothetical protein
VKSLLFPNSSRPHAAFSHANNACIASIVHSTQVAQSYCQEMHKAISVDMFPNEITERIFGIQMNHPLGTRVLGAWQQVFPVVPHQDPSRRDAVGAQVCAAAVKHALLTGQLPALFREAVAALVKAGKANQYTLAVHATQGRGLPWDHATMSLVAGTV